MKTLTLTLLAVIILHSAHAQFQHAFGTGKLEQGQSVQTATLDRGYIVAGYTDYTIFGDREATLIKTKPDGFPGWYRVYGGTRYDVFNSVREVNITTSPNLPPGYAALGTTSSFGMGSEDIYFVRTDLAGNPLYSRTLGFNKNDRGNCLQFIKDERIGYGFVLVGETNSYPYYAGTDVYVAKLDELGNLAQAVVIGGEGDETGYWIEQTLDGGFIVVGTTTTRTCGATIPNQDIFVIRLKSDLSLQWNAIIGGANASPYPDIAYGVVENPDDKSFTITGRTESFGVSNSGDAFLLNLSATGTFNWMKTYGLEKTEQGNSIHLARSPLTGRVEYVVSGYSNTYSGYEEAYVFRTDAIGSLQWTSLYRMKSTSQATEITDNGERGFIFTGRVDPFSSLQNDIYLVKIDENGKSQTVCDEFVRQKEIRNDVCITSSAQQVYVEEIKRVESLYKEIPYEIKVCDPLASSAAPDENPVEFELMPNPSQDRLKIHINNEALEGAALKIYNSRGAKVAEQALTTQDLDLQISHLPNDVYVIHFIKKDGSVVYKRFVKK